MTTWARVEASRHDHTASHHLMQAPTSQLVRKRVEKERIERAFRLQDRDRSGVIEGPALRRRRRLAVAVRPLRCRQGRRRAARLRARVRRRTRLRDARVALDADARP